MEIELCRAVGLQDYLGRLAWKNGKEITITREGEPYLKLLPHPDGTASEEHKRTRGIGSETDQTWTAPELPETSEEIIESFEGKWSNGFC
jgi:antitoxin (DNA-binding transcriptional repressor) of toxin-antitoxin stability system